MDLPVLDGLSATELDALLAATRDEAADIIEAFSVPQTADSADLDRLDVLATHVDALEGALATLAAAGAARVERAATLSARFAQPEPEPESEADPEPEPEVDLAAAEPDADDKKDTKNKPKPVVAATRPAGKPGPKAKDVVVLAPKAKDIVVAPREVSIVAAAGLPDMRGGTVTTLLDLVKPAVQKWGSYAGASSGQIQDQLFTVHAPERDPRLVAKGHNDQAVMEYATDQFRLVNASTGKTGLIASGGWCAPAEQRFDVCTLAEVDGIWDGPTISMPRGSISYFRQLDYSVVNTDLNVAGLFSFTNAELVATPPVVKPCFEIPCQTPVTGTLDARGLCLRAGILQQKAFPELIAAWMDLAMIAYAHFLNAHNLAEMVAGSTAVAMPQTFGAIASLLETVSLQAMDYRFDQGMAIDATLEVVFPWWVPALLSADFSKRQFLDLDGAGGRTYGLAEFSADLAARDIQAQFVKDFDDTIFTGAGNLTVWPETIQFLLYAPGAWVRGQEDIISVSTLYDSTLLQTNKVQLLFIEAGTKMLPWCGPSRIVSVNLCPSGATAGPIASTPGAYTCPSAG